MASSTPTRLRQIALVVEDLKRAEYLLTTVLGSEVIYVDPQVGQWGLENILVAIGGDVIEVVAPVKPGTAAGRLLSKRGDGGYMIVMQTADAAARKTYIEENGLGKVIYYHEHEDAVCVQYHPKGIHGGIMPELDSHRSTSNHPDPVSTTYSPWHTCGSDYPSYSAGMKRNSHLQFVSAVCRISPTVAPTAAAQQWSSIFDVPSQRNELLYTNMKMSFTAGAEGEAEGLEWITIAVHRKEKFDRILERASEEGLCGDGWINMLGVKWYFVLVESNAGNEADEISRL
ncbi:hypothetical protein B7494_g995 [Chlorociboria aeruginascens]|nr:hypothetical protein B7494_g995 [Chlorociboria aeruginascens]